MTPDIRKERETALYEAALRLIAKGVNPAAMKVQQIADEAGIGKGTVYEYFASKDEILQGMALYCFDTEIARIAVLMLYIGECDIIWATDQPEGERNEYNPKAGKTDIDLVDPAATRSSMAAEMVRDVPLLLFSMDILSAGQCAVRNGSAFIPDEAVAGDGSTSNADRRICDFYDSAGGWQRGCVFGTGGSNDSASMVHIRKGET